MHTVPCTALHLPSDSLLSAHCRHGDWSMRLVMRLDVFLFFSHEALTKSLWKRSHTHFGLEHSVIQIEEEAQNAACDDRNV